MQTALLLAAAPASWDDPSGGRAQRHVSGWGVGPRFRPRLGPQSQGCGAESRLAQLCPPLCEAFRSCWPGCIPRSAGSWAGWPVGGGSLSLGPGVKLPPGPCSAPP